MLDIPEDVDSLTNFKRQTADDLRRRQTTGSPLVLTVNGKTAVVVQHAAADQRLVERAARTDRDETVAAIRDGLADAEAGRVKPARRALKALARKYGIPTSDE